MTQIRRDNNYRITKKTNAIIHSNWGEFQSKIVDEQGEYYSVHSPREILSFNCIRHHSSLEGRELAAKRILQTNSKLPISINPDLGLYFFPTTSPRNTNCVWISYYQISDYLTVDTKTTVYFYDGTSITTDVSIHVLEQQFKKTSQLIASFYRDLTFN